MNETHSCPQCGKPASAEVLHGLCPECMMKVGLETQSGAGGATQPETPPRPLAEIAQLFPQLEIHECLGSGGMGAVYKARHKRLDRLVALKILRDPPDQKRDPQFLERFEREARALAKLNHPNIVAVHDFGEAGGLPYLIMEFVDGVNLRQLQRVGRLSPAEALRIVPQICDALQFAHETGIVHRDIKPENILLDQRGRVKIADFGIAKLLGVDQARAALTQNQVLGTPHYMAPEQVEHPQGVDRRADIYSLGVVFYEMLTGELPLGKFAPPSSRIQSVQVDVRLDEIVLRALEKEPERRYQEAREVKTDVEMISGKANPSPPRNAENPLPASEPGHPAAVRPVSRLGFPLFVLPSILLMNFVLFGARWFGVDLDADIQAYSGLVGLPLSAGLGALLAWAVRLLLESSISQSETTVSPSRRWSVFAIASGAILGLSLPLGGGALVLLQLTSRDPSWNPGSGEFVLTVLMGGGALLIAILSTLMGFEALRRIRLQHDLLRGRPAAVAAAWFWPCLLASLVIGWGANAGLSALYEKQPAYRTGPVIRGSMSAVILSQGKLRTHPDDPLRSASRTIRGQRSWKGFGKATGW